MTFDPRTMGQPVFEALHALRLSSEGDKTRLKEQKNQAVELYTYLSTWGLLRLKAEEQILTSQEGKRQVVVKFFECLEEVAEPSKDEGNRKSCFAGEEGLEYLKNLSTDEYLGLSGLGLAIAREFSFWATAVYYDITGD